MWEGLYHVFFAFLNNRPVLHLHDFFGDAFLFD
ncbi:hypothetical protein MGA3_12810 [Bacillus methanolicus MGA3]|nr:hypothetical protein MGA3_12810 [Bacillus methanolicus MGA3]